MRIEVTVNGISHADDVAPRTLLVHYLRDQLGLRAANVGCDTTSCGACTVLLDGRRVNSCLVLAVAADSAQVTTIEGLSAGDDLHPMQQAFVDFDALQCGYCTPGQICSAIGALDEADKGWPSAVTNDLDAPISLDGDEIRERMSGNICRCGAYVNIVAAIEDVAR